MVQRTDGNPIKGYSVYYFIQSVDAPLGAEGILPAHRTDGSMTLGGEDLDEQSAQGRIVLKGTDEDTIELTQYVVPNDPTLEILEDAKRSGKNVKVWRVLVDESVAEGDGAAKTYPAHFGYGRPGELSFTDGDSLAEVSYPLNISGALKKGRFPLSDEDIAMIESIYEYQNPGESTGDLGAVETGDGTAV